MKIWADWRAKREAEREHRAEQKLAVEAMYVATAKLHEFCESKGGMNPFEFVVTTDDDRWVVFRVRAEILPEGKEPAPAYKHPLVRP